MKIKETIERECCESQDMIFFKKGFMEKDITRFKPRVCKHCGNIWALDSETSPCGDTETILSRIRITEWTYVY